MKGPIKKSSKPQQLKYSKDQKKLLGIAQKKQHGDKKARKNSLTASKMFVGSLTGNKNRAIKGKKK